MATQRHIEKLSTIFDLKIGRALCLDDSISTRVMLIYDRNKNQKEFKVLGKGTTIEMNGLITSWLEENMDINDIIIHLNQDEINIDTISKPHNC